MRESFESGYAEALARVGGDHQLMAELAQIFQSEAHPALERISDAVRHQDAKELWQAAHLIKGHVAIFGASGPQRTLARMEDRGLDADFCGIDLELEKLKQQIVDLLDDLRILNPAPGQ